MVKLKYNGISCEGGHVIIPSFHLEGRDNNMEFLFELLKEIARTVVRVLSAYVLRKQLQKRDSKKPTLRRRKLKSGSKKR
ncbi:MULTISPECIES: hypothetical protein [Bacillus cereus group]|uniref:hypothetical protein n=1 Tax=Bacillus cereus group TaxID=86661 RepID=UPI000279EAC5|nr:hypothetical protein [Bacillus cereus]EJR28467.1 hypothetical protein IIE_05306 [Bacillus cereus VD045]HDR4350504.1 hypothetical protein [Bacillus cereus]HDR6957490.1 hypothetical protein [Bacillus cereus]